MTGRPELPADALGTSGSSSCCWEPWEDGRPLALFPVGTILPLVGVLLPVVAEPLLPVRGFLDLTPVGAEGTAGTGALINNK